MRTLIAIVIFCLCVVQTSQGQTDSVMIKKFYQTWVYPDLRNKKSYGSLFEVKDSSILVANTVKKDVLLSGNFAVSEIFTDKIYMIDLKKSGNKRIGTTIGALTGLGAGLITDIALMLNNHGSDTGSKEFDELGNAISVTALILLPLATTATGLLIGHLIDAGAKKRRLIKHDQSRFDASRSWLSEYSLKHLVD